MTYRARHAAPRHAAERQRRPFPQPKNVFRITLGAVATVVLVAGGIVVAREPATEISATAETPAAAEIPAAEVPAGPPAAAAAAVITPRVVVPATKRPTHSPTKANSPWVVVNKARSLSPIAYVPDLTTVAGKQVAVGVAADLKKLINASARAGAPIQVVSGYRSYTRQKQLYNQQVARQGSRSAADKLSARPGHSEHQTGLAVDINSAGTSRCQLHPCFGQSAAGRWIAKHAGEYGFLVRYTAANAATTGYSAEPWHLRYVGTKLIKAMAAAKVDTLEEYFDLSGGR